MKHYLKLVPISAKIHRKQSKMTRICITLAVLLVAVMFGLADMYLQGVTRHEMEESGNWHYEFHSIDTQTASFISARPDVEIAGWHIKAKFVMHTETSFSMRALAIHPAK